MLDSANKNGYKKLLTSARSNRILRVLAKIFNLFLIYF